jgi:cytidylate kinase
MSDSEKSPVITIDGPSGTGKGTISYLLQSWLKWHLIDSGAFYRVLALSVLNNEVSVLDEKKIASLASELSLEFIDSGTETRILFRGNDCNSAIRSEACGVAASQIAVYSSVRAELLSYQRNFAVLPGLIADGRDMGTVVFPNADLKIFLTASPEERVSRRYKQLIKKGIDANLPDLLRNIKERDERDINRSQSPLKASEEAVLIDTSSLEIDEVMLKVRQLVRIRGLA